MKRTKFAVYVYAADGSTLPYLVGKLARLASISDNRPAQMYLEQIAIQDHQDQDQDHDQDQDQDQDQDHE